MISDPCSCCRGTGRVEALETTFSKIERAILRLVVIMCLLFYAVFGTDVFLFGFFEMKTVSYTL